MIEVRKDGFVARLKTSLATLVAFEVSCKPEQKAGIEAFEATQLEVFAEGSN